MLHILVVEDNETDILMIREGLRWSNVSSDLLIARDGEQALRILTETKPDLVLLDVNIPKLDGFAVLEQCQLLPDAPPIIMLTGCLNESDRQRALVLGARDYFVKATDFAGLITMVKDVVERFGGSEAESATAAE